MKLSKRYTPFEEIAPKFIEEFFPQMSKGTFFFNELYTIAYTNASKSNYRNKKVVLVAFENKLKNKLTLAFEEYMEHIFNNLSELDTFTEEDIRDVEFKRFIK